MFSVSITLELDGVVMEFNLCNYKFFRYFFNSSEKLYHKLKWAAVFKSKQMY